jgi:hypothetical protein
LHACTRVVKSLREKDDERPQLFAIGLHRGGFLVRYAQFEELPGREFVPHKHHPSVLDPKTLPLHESRNEELSPFKKC